MMVMMLIVQVSQLMIGQVVVHYAAYAAARERGGVDSRPILPRRKGPIASVPTTSIPTRRPGSRPRSERCGLRPGRRRRDLSGRAGQPEVQQDRLGRRDGVHADLAFARPGPARRRRRRGRRRHQGGLRARMAPSSAAQRRRPGRLDHKLAYALEQHDGRASLLPQGRGAAAGDL